MVFQAIESFAVEPFPPFGDDSARQVQAFRDLLVFHTGSCQEDDLGANHLVIRGCVLPGHIKESLLLGARKRDNEWACARHFAFLLPEVPIYCTFISRSSKKYVTVFRKRST
jgi:hypothetical protein